MEAADKGELSRAIDLLNELEKHEKSTAAIYWNLGIWHADLQQHREAIVAWQKLRKLYPENWRVATKLIQSYQTMGDLANRDQERETLFRLWRSKTDGELSKQPDYCREQFVIGKQRVMVFEVFEPSGDFAILHFFYLLGSEGKVASRYSLGSYETTNRYLRETGVLKGREDLPSRLL